MLLNRKCNYCGNEYYVCRACTRKSSWKNVCCSKECFVSLQKLDGIKPIIINEGASNMADILFKVELFNGLTYDIIGYDVDLGRFDCDGGKTLTYNDIKLFYLTSDIVKDIVETVSKQTEIRVNALKQDKKANKTVSDNNKEE